MLAWNLGVSHVGMWTAEHETVARSVAHNMVRLFTAMLHSSPQVFKELTSISGANKRKWDEGRWIDEGLHGE